MGNVVITFSANALALIGPRPSASTVATVEFNMCFCNIRFLSRYIIIFPSLHVVIEYGRQDVKLCPGILFVNLLYTTGSHVGERRDRCGVAITFANDADIPMYYVPSNVSQYSFVALLGTFRKT